MTTENTAIQVEKSIHLMSQIQFAQGVVPLRSFFSHQPSPKLTKNGFRLPLCSGGRPHDFLLMFNACWLRTSYRLKVINIFWFSHNGGNEFPVVYLGALYKTETMPPFDSSILISLAVYRNFSITCCRILSQRQILNFNQLLISILSLRLDFAVSTI